VHELVIIETDHIDARFKYEVKRRHVSALRTAHQEVTKVSRNTCKNFCFVDRASLCNLVNRINLVHTFS